MWFDEWPWGVCKHSSSSILIASFGNVYRRLVAATRRLQELLKGLLDIPLLAMQCTQLNRNLRSIDSIGYVHTAYLSTLRSVWN